MIRRTFFKLCARAGAGALGVGMLGEVLLSKGPTMEVVTTISQRPVAEMGYNVGDRGIDLGPRVRDRKDMDYKFEHRFGIVYLNGMRDVQ